MLTGKSSSRLAALARQRSNNMRNSLRYAAATTSQQPSPYPLLQEPLQLTGGVTLRNRVLMGSMHTGLEEPEGGGLFSSGTLDEMAAFYAARSKGQVGLIVTGGIAPNGAGRGYPGAAKLSTIAESDMHRVVTQVRYAAANAAAHALHLSSLSSSRCLN